MLRVELFLYHPSLLCHSIVLGKTTPPHSLVWEEIDFYVYAHPPPHELPFLSFCAFKQGESRDLNEQVEQK